MRFVVCLFSVVVFLLVAGCSSSGGGGSNNPPVSPPAAPVLAVGFSLKTLQFTWGAVNDTTHYRLLERPNSVSAYSQVGVNLATNTTSHNLEIAVHKKDWTGVRYILQACNNSGCTDSAAIDVLSGVLNTIGYIKAEALERTNADLFGFSVALSADGNTLAVGAPVEHNSTAGVGGGSATTSCSPTTTACTRLGAVYVYSRSSGTWVQQVYIKAPDPHRGDMFGSAVALNTDGTVLAVGAAWENVPGGAGDVGAVYVYRRSGSVWAHEADIQAPHRGEENFFGTAVALSGDGQTLIVGAPKEDSDQVGIFGPGSALASDCGSGAPTNCADRSGAVYIYASNDTGGVITWPLQAYVKASDASDFDEFGTSVAISNDGDTVAVGSMLRFNSGGIRSGAVYVYNRDAGALAQWTEGTGGAIGPSNPDHNDHFGFSVALSSDGNTLAVGADGEDSNDTNNGADNGAGDSGAVYVYVRASGNWTEQAYVKPSNIGAGDEFGFAVALSGDGNTLAVSARGEDGGATGVGGVQDENVANAGAVYVYDRSGMTWTQRSYVKAPNTDADDEFGAAFDSGVTGQKGRALALSANGETLAVGACREDGSGTGIGTGAGLVPTENGELQSGAVYLY